MTKNEFLSALERQLASLPESDRKRSILYFDEIIADRMEEGLTEEEVLAEMESVEEIAKGILSDAAEEPAAPQNVPRKVGGCPLWLAILLAVLASPIWLPIAFSVAATLVTIYMVPWILILTLFCVAIAFIFGGLAGIVLALICWPVNGVYITLLAVGICIFLTGFGILLMFPAVILTRWLARGTVWCCRKLASLRKGGKTV